MLASDLIRRLQDLIKKHGDLPVRFPAGTEDSDIQCLRVYDKAGNSPGETFCGKPTGAAAEIYLHWGGEEVEPYEDYHS